jgi:ABC-type nitrate/sulfonate/bicarbonate transport system substrate-binding protein
MARIRIASAALALLWLAAGLGQPAAQTPAPAHKGKIVITQAVDALSFLPMYVGRAKGFWEAEGLDAEVRIVKGGPIVTSAVIAGQAQFTATSADAPLLARRAGGTILIVANILDKGPAEIVIHKEVLAKNVSVHRLPPVLPLRREQGRVIRARASGVECRISNVE